MDTHEVYWALNMPYIGYIYSPKGDPYLPVHLMHWGVGVTLGAINIDDIEEVEVHGRL